MIKGVYKKGEEKMGSGRGQRLGCCEKCHKRHPSWGRWNTDRMRAIYIREPDVGFKRIGWLFEKCGHIEIDRKESKESKVDTG